MDISIGASYGADTDATRAALEQCVEQIEGVIADPPHQIFLKELGASSVDWVVRVWCKTEDYWDVHQSTIRAAKKALERANINIPFPQLDVHFDEDAAKVLSRR